MSIDSTVVRLYLRNKLMDGSLKALSPEIRLLESISGITALHTLEDEQDFLILTDVSLQPGCCGVEKTSFAYVKRSMIHIAAAFSADSGRGLGAVAGLKRYPFINKSPFPVVLDTSDYEIKGNIYLTPSQQSHQLLENEPLFLPVTDVEICSLTNGTHWQVPFAAVNKDQIVSMIDAFTQLPELMSNR
jgi:hypothetical protein